MATKNKGKSSDKSELREALDELKPVAWRGLVFTFFITILALTGSIYMMALYGSAVPARSLTTLEMLTIMVIGAYLVAEALEWVRHHMAHEASVVLDARLGDRVFNAMFEANQRGFPVGNGQPLTDLKNVREFIAGPVVQALLIVPMIPILIIAIFAFHWIMGFVVVVVALLHILVGYLSRKATGDRLISANKAAIGAQLYADGALRNAQVVEAMGMQANIYRRWIDKQREFLQEQAEASDQASTFQAISKFLQLVVGSLLIGTGAAIALSGWVEGDAATRAIGASILAAKIFSPFASIVSNWRSIINSKEAWGRLDRLLMEFPAKGKALKLPTPRGVLAAEAVVATAPGSQVPIIKGVTFTLQPGEVLAIIGPSASGKTSMARLIVGIWAANSGKVRLDGVDVYAWDKNELGPYLGYLPQDVELFDGSVADNIARFGDVDMAKVEDAARAVGLHEFVLGLPQGYDTQIGGEGAKLSGGQRQRVALARALYANPVLVVLDEPNSSLDDEGDAALSAAIATLKARGTTFVVNTHRTSILGVTDKILVLRDGYQHAFGPKDQVMEALRNPQGAKPVAQGLPQPAAAGATSA